MDFSVEPWTWILPALAAGAILVWFVLGLISRGLEFYRSEIEAERESRRSDELVKELRAVSIRLAALERAQGVEPRRPRAVR